MDVSIVILTLVFLAMFLVPFLTISIMQKVKEHKKRKQPESAIESKGEL